MSDLLAGRYRIESDMLTTELAAGEQLRSVPGENVSQMRINLALADAESHGRETLARIWANLGSTTSSSARTCRLGDKQNPTPCRRA